MRSIGKRNIGRIQRIIQEELPNIDQQQFGWITELSKRVWERIPQEIIDTWEGSQSEIEAIIEEYTEGL